MLQQFLFYFQILQQEQFVLNQDHHGGSVRYSYRTKNNRTQYINADSFEMEPLCFPLLFPYGERGWGNDLKTKKIQLFPYLASRLLRPEPNLFEVFEKPINRFHVRMVIFTMLRFVVRCIMMYF